jgi:hypothetical protein
VKLRVLYISNNKIGNWGEVQKLTQNPTLRSVLLRGNPIYTQTEKSLDDLALMVLKRVSFLE